MLVFNIPQRARGTDLSLYWIIRQLSTCLFIRGKMPEILALKIRKGLRFLTYSQGRALISFCLGCYPTSQSPNQTLPLPQDVRMIAQNHQHFLFTSFPQSLGTSLSFNACPLFFILSSLYHIPIYLPPFFVRYFPTPSKFFSFPIFLTMKSNLNQINRAAT